MSNKIFYAALLVSIFCFVSCTRAQPANSAAQTKPAAKTETIAKIQNPARVIHVLVALRFTLLANGQISDVTVFSDAPKLVISRATALLKELKFIPAKIDGKPVDSQQTIKYIFGG